MRARYYKLNKNRLTLKIVQDRYRYTCTNTRIHEQTPKIRINSISATFITFYETRCPLSWLENGTYARIARYSFLQRLRTSTKRASKVRSLRILYTRYFSRTEKTDIYFIQVNIHIQYWTKVNWKYNRNRTTAVLKCFAIFKNAVHSLEPGETPTNSASHQAQNHVQRS